MKPHEYRYQVRTYQNVTCDSCGHQFRKYGSVLWDEPLERGITWPENLRIRSAFEQTNDGYIGFEAWSDKADGFAVGRCEIETCKFTEDFHLSWGNSQPMPSIGAV